MIIRLRNTEYMALACIRDKCLLIIWEFKTANYFIKDHQQNNRLAFGELPYRQVYLTTMETERATAETTADELGPAWVIDAQTRTPVANHTPLGKESAVLHGATHPLGPALSLEVAKGDRISMEAWAKYTTLNPTTTATDGLGEALAGALGLSGTDPTTETIYHTISDLFGLGGAVGVFTTNTTLETPDAYLQYLLFYEDSTFHQAGFTSVTLNALDRFEHLTLDLEVGEDFTSGFMYIYVANESSQDVYFDDVQVTHESATSSFKVSQINEYYPFGLTTSRSWRNAGYVDPGLLYQSSYASYDSVTGYYDFLSRSYDPVLGRFFAVDPAGQFGSPYVGMGNMPMMTVDPDGELAWFVPLIIGGVINTAIQGITKGFENGWQVLGAFAVGAATSAVTMGIGNGLTSGFNFASHASGSLTFGQGFAAGVQGTFSGSALNVSFASGASSFFRGAAVGGSTGLAGGFIGGFGNAWNGGESLKNSLNQGLVGGGIGSLSGGLYGGVKEGIRAMSRGYDFWTGSRQWETREYTLPNNQGVPIFRQKSDEVGCTQECFNSVSAYEGQNFDAPINGAADYRQLGESWGYDVRRSPNHPALIGQRLEKGHISTITYNRAGTQHSVNINSVTYRQRPRLFNSSKIRESFRIDVMDPLDKTGTYSRLANSSFKSGIIRTTYGWNPFEVWNIHPSLFFFLTTKRQCLYLD